MNTQENLFIATAQAEFEQSAVTELQQMDRSIKSNKKLAPGIVLCEAPNAQYVMKNLSLKLPTFVRHLAPVQTIIEIDNSERDLGEIAVGTIQLPRISLLSKGTRFAVQTRLVQTDKSLGERAYSSGQVNKLLAEALAEETDAIENIKKPEVVISVLCTMREAYLGISTVEENLSAWPGGARHYAQTDEQISRAEFKLLEALEVFGVALPTQGRALDLGAAPGGWTRLLLDQGLSVIAVDPARLDPRLAPRKGLEHYRGYAEDFIDDAVSKHKQFDIIVNDMRMDAREAARLLSQSAQCLHPDGIVVSVFKLPHATEIINPLRTLKEALNILQKRYNIVRTHQLFHNRQEITLVAAQPIRAKITQHRAYGR